jgi:Bacterial RNA polymerase, alpha chain C terminal domain
MSDDKKSTDPGLSAAERKTLRGHEAQEAISDHKAAQKAFHENRERLREERVVREAAEGPMVTPTPELSDDTPIERVLFSIRIQNALKAADLKTVGEVREVSEATLISLPDFGRGSLSELARSWASRRPVGLDTALFHRRLEFVAAAFAPFLVLAEFQDRFVSSYFGKKQFRVERVLGPRPHAILPPARYSTLPCRKLSRKLYVDGRV